MCLLFFFTNGAHAQLLSPAIKTYYYTVAREDSFFNILIAHIGIPGEFLYHQKYLEKLKEWNPKLDSLLDRVPPGEVVYIELPYNIKLKPLEPIVREVEVIKEVTREVASQPPPSEPLSCPEPQVIEAPPCRCPDSTSESAAPVAIIPEPPAKIWNFSVFYTLSHGSFEERIINSDKSLNSFQDSPITLGVGAGYAFSKALKSNYSFYGSKLDAAISSDQNENVSLPFEYGGTAYLSYAPEYWPFEVYGGFDLERFTTFNTAEVATVDDAPIKTINNQLTFGTLGLSKVFSLFKRTMIFKSSYSHTLTSSTSSSDKEAAFTGSKFILFLGTRLTEHWGTQVFYKQHDFQSLTALHMTRIGLGFSYNF